MFVDHTVFYDIWSLKVSKTTEMWLLTGSPIVPNRPFVLHRPPRGSHRTQGGGTAHFGTNDLHE